MRPASQRRYVPSLVLALLVGATGLSIGCGTSDKPKPAATRDAGTGQAVKTALQKEIELSLKLETVLDNTKRDLAEAEAANPRDEAHIAERKMAVDAVTNRLEESRKKIEFLRARGEK